MGTFVVVGETSGSTAGDGLSSAAKREGFDFGLNCFLSAATSLVIADVPLLG